MGDTYTDVVLTFTEDEDVQRWKVGNRTMLGGSISATGIYEVVKVEERPIVERVYTLRFVEQRSFAPGERDLLVSRG